MGRQHVNIKLEAHLSMYYSLSYWRLTRVCIAHIVINYLYHPGHKPQSCSAHPQWWIGGALSMRGGCVCVFIICQA